jgi:pilin isopeptide linkage protein
LKSKIITRIALVLSLIVLLTSTVQTTFGFLYTDTDPITGAFVPELTQPGSLTVTKTVRHPFGDSYRIPVSFSFKISLGSDYATATLNTSQGALTTDQNGDLTVQISHGTPFVINDLATGTSVTVRELPISSSGFTAENNVTQKQVTITENGAVAEFVNIYRPAPVSAASISLNGVKELEGRPWQNGDSFTFVLNQKNGNDWNTLGTATVTYNNTADFNKFDMSTLLDNVSFDSVGEYFFRIYEEEGNLDNISYDKTVKEFKVTVTDTDMDGYLEIASVSGAQNVDVSKNGSNYNVSVTFNNTFVPLPDPDPITLQIVANKTVNNIGTLILGPDGFEMVLKNSDTNQATALKTQNGKAIFDLTFDKTDVGTHVFTLFETKGDIKGMTYDPAVHTVTVVVSLEDNQLKATINDVQATEFNASFTNIYDAKQDDPTPTGDSGKYFWLVMTVVSTCTFIALLVVDKRRSLKV